MQLFVTILHIFLCFALILIILLQPGKEGAAAFGGGGGNQMYGPRGSGHFLGRATTVVAALFMFTSITLALYSSTRVQADSDLEEGIDQLQGSDEEGFDIDLGAGGMTAPDAPSGILPAGAPSDAPEPPAAAPDGAQDPAPTPGLDALDDNVQETPGAGTAPDGTP